MKHEERRKSVGYDASQQTVLTAHSDKLHYYWSLEVRISTVHINSLVLFTDLLPLLLKVTNTIHATVTVFSSENRPWKQANARTNVAEVYNDAGKLKMDGR